MIPKPDAENSRELFLAPLPSGETGEGRQTKPLTLRIYQVKEKKQGLLALPYWSIMHYQIIKVNSHTAEEIDFGLRSDFGDVLRITRGYRYNGIFFTRKNCKWFYIVLTISE